MCYTMLFVVLSCFLLSLYEVRGHVDDSAFTLEHCTNTDLKFTTRGYIGFRGAGGSYAFYSQETKTTQAELDSLQALADQDGIYRIRIPVKINDTTEYISTFTRACLVVASDLHEAITISIDGSQNVVGLHLSPEAVDCGAVAGGGAAGGSTPAGEGGSGGRGGAPHYSSSSGAAAYNMQRLTPGVDTFRATVNVHAPVTAPVPDTVNYIRKMDREREEKAKADQGDKGSFLSKYWIYIVVIGISVMMFSQAADQNAGGGR